jgi:ABC-type lipoprotein release transport system permease subunit
MTLLMRLAWRNIWRQRRRTLITTVAMAAGLASCLAMVCLVDGTYVQMFDDVVTRTTGHAQLHHPEYPSKRAMYETIPDAATLLLELEALPAVRGATARVHGHALVGTEQKVVGAMLLGIDPARESTMTELDRWVEQGRYLDPTIRGELLLGSGLAENLRVGPGAAIMAVTQAADGSMGNEAFTVAGVVNTGDVMKDRSGAWMLAEDLQDLLVLPGQVHEIALLSAGRDAVPSLMEAVAPAAGSRGLLLRSWAELNPQMARMLELSDASMLILLFIIFGVAALGILNTMLMSVFERTKELGVIKALGLRPLQLVRLVLWESIWLAAVAVLIGLPLGLAMDAWLVWVGLDLSGVMEGISMMGARWDPVMFGAFRVQPVIVAVVGLFIVSLLASLWPALRAARLQPVQAMRQE